MLGQEPVIPALLLLEYTACEFGSFLLRLDGVDLGYNGVQVSFVAFVYFIIILFNRCEVLTYDVELVMKNYGHS